MKTQNIRVTHVFRVVVFRVVFRVVVVLAQMFAHLHHTSYIFPYIIYRNIFYITVYSAKYYQILYLFIFISMSLFWLREVCFVKLLD